MRERGGVPATARTGAARETSDVAFVTGTRVVVVGCDDVSDVGALELRLWDFAADRLDGRTVTTDDVFMLDRPNHNNGPTTTRKRRGPRTKRLTRRKVRPLRRTNHSKPVIDGS